MYYTYVYLNSLKPGNYIYGKISFNYEPFYVGKGQKNRYLYHLNKVKNNLKYKTSLKFDIIKENINSNVEPIILKVFESDSEDKCLQREEYLIKKIGRINLNTGPLTNMNDGGIKPQNNYKHTKKTKQKISKSSKIRKPNGRYDLISPDGVLYKNVNLLKFCNKNYLNYDKIRKSFNIGKIIVRNKNTSKKSTLNCEGWEVINNRNKNIKEKEIKYTLISPDKKKYLVYSNESCEKLCKKLSLNFRVLKIYRNKGLIKIRNINQCKKITSINCQFWEFIDHKNNNKENFTSDRKISWKITTPYNKTIMVSNLKEFCKNNNLSYRTFLTFRNRGIVNLKIRKNYNDNVINTIGWSCYSL